MITWKQIEYIGDSHYIDKKCGIKSANNLYIVRFAGGNIKENDWYKYEIVALAYPVEVIPGNIILIPNSKSFCPTNKTCIAKTFHCVPQKYKEIDLRFKCKWKLIKYVGNTIYIDPSCGIKHDTHKSKIYIVTFADNNETVALAYQKVVNPNKYKMIPHSECLCPTHGNCIANQFKSRPLKYLEINLKGGY